MNVKTFDLDKMKVSPMNTEEMAKVDGGFWWFLIPIAAFIIGYIAGVANSTGSAETN